ncbi:MAG: HsdR family type I site-specific deoxyribonuclease, partial [Candidatus Heimdallarchaeota archaeon]|nr:HsdR family type I site-specific deoxyribonuclease [Candidatus Heimdallarchaeota archaeon]
MSINEDQLEQYCIETFEDIDYEYILGTELEERESPTQVVLQQRLQDSIYKLNKDLPNSAREQAINQLLRIDTPDLLLQNQYVHNLLVKGVTVTYFDKGENKSDIVRLIDFENPENNDFLVVNQYTVIEGIGHQKRNRRPDIVVFLNGLPLVVIELKNPADEKTEIEDAYNQLQTYKQDIPSLFRYNELLVISDGLEAQAGSLSANFERFIPWRTIDGDTEAAPNQWQIEILIRGLLHPARLLDYIRYFITFEDDGSNLIKKSAAYHQFHAVNRAVSESVRATAEKGDSKIGVVWHTQGSGKSLTMLFYSAKIIQLLNNPTILVLTDRNDLDGQLFNTFALSRDLLRDEPKQAQDRLEIRELLKTTGGGVIFSTIQKFLPGEDETEYPVLTERKNVIVIADEAHRSQYSFQKSAKVTYNKEEKMEDIAIK